MAVRSSLWWRSFFFLVVGWVCPLVAWGSPLPHFSTPTTDRTSPTPLQINERHPTQRIAQKQPPHVQLTVKLVYAYTQDKKSVDPDLQKDLPSLKRMFDFNVYRLLRTIRHSIPYKKALIVPINENYQVQLNPQHYHAQEQKIALRTTFLHRKRANKNNKIARFNAYASTHLRLQNGGKVAFLGPAYHYGRILLIVTALQFYP